MGFLRHEYWTGLPLLPQGIFLTQGLNLHLLLWQRDSSPLCQLGSPMGIKAKHPGHIWPLYKKNQAKSLCRTFLIASFDWDNYKMWKKVKVTQSHLTCCNPMDTVHGILQARILGWVAFPFSRGSSQPKDRIQVSHIAGGFFTSWAINLWNS